MPIAGLPSAGLGSPVLEAALHISDVPDPDHRITVCLDWLIQNVLQFHKTGDLDRKPAISSVKGSRSDQLIGRDTILRTAAASML